MPDEINVEGVNDLQMVYRDGWRSGDEPTRFHEKHRHFVFL
jgi:hypothetical protein